MKKIQAYITFHTKLIQINHRGERGIMGHGELRTSVIFLKTVSNYCPKTFFLSFLIVALYLEHQLNCAPPSLLSYDSS